MIQQALFQRFMNPLLRQMAGATTRQTAPAIAPAMRNFSSAPAQLSKAGQGMSELDLFKVQRDTGLIKLDPFKPSRHGAGKLDVMI